MLFVSQPKTEPAERCEIAWDEAPCPVCAGRHWTPLLEAQDQQSGQDGLWFAIVQCDSCGTCFTNPRPDATSIANFQQLATHTQDSCFQLGKRRWNPLSLPGSEAQLKKRISRSVGPGRLLDFGCGDGEFLLDMQKRGWQVTRLDPCQQTADRLRDELGVTAHAGTLPHFDLDPDSFDVITMWHSLERVHDPLAALREARQLLIPGGHLVLTVPNIDSWPFRWFGRHWAGLNLPRHLTHFTPASLPQLLQRAGFTTERVEFARRSDWLCNSARVACRQPDAWPWQTALTFRAVAYLTTWACYFAQQTDSLFAIAHR